MNGSMVTPLDVLNNALARCAQPPVNNFNPLPKDPKDQRLPESRAGLALAQLYASTVEQVERDFKWQELTVVVEMKSQELLVDEDDDRILSEEGAELRPIAVGVSHEKDYEGRYIYPLKNLDVLRPLELKLPLNMAGVDAKTTLTQAMLPGSNVVKEYSIEDDTLRCYLPHLFFMYIRRSLDPSEWTSELQDCVSAKLAANGAPLATGQLQAGKFLNEEYKQALRDAKRLQSKYKHGITYGGWAGRFPLDTRV